MRADVPSLTADAVEEVFGLALQLPEDRGGPAGILPGAAEQYPAAIGFGDACNLGRRQLLVMFHTGAHATVFRVYGVLRPGQELEQLAELRNTNGAAFELTDFDTDGQTEIGTLEYVPEELYEGTRPLVNRPLRPIYYRWEVDHFVVIKRGELYDPLTSKPPSAVAQFLRRPSWSLARGHGNPVR